MIAADGAGQHFRALATSSSKRPQGSHWPPVHSASFHGMHNQMHLRLAMQPAFLHNPPASSTFSTRIRTVGPRQEWDYPAVIPEAALENTLLTSVPRVVKIVIAATLMRKTRSAYSTKSCPSSFDHSLRKVPIIFRSLFLRNGFVKTCLFRNLGSNFGRTVGAHDSWAFLHVLLCLAKSF